MAAAVATRPGETLLDLHLRWTPGTRPSSAGYRDAPPAAEEAALHDALVGYLEGGGEHVLAGYLTDSVIDESVPSQVSIRIAPSARDALRGHARGIATLTAAVRDLLADARTRVRVR